ncbi:MAG: nicotinate (nicotinamide) nucleotide adenylyltransferase [Bacilli bacterium]|nr:nicotinate (nicotinamide) nucleotide adenylyltransferase [Bacilli bacterium]
MKIIIYPGSFDPLHNGHLTIARTAKKAINADKVLFLLSPSTVWKKVDTPFKHRANMLKMGINGEEGFEISLVEEKNEGKTNYTYLTISKLKEKFPDDELFLLLGEDQAEVFDKWMNPDEIAKNATILVYKRKGSTLSDYLKNRFNMQEISGPLRNVSSSAVRHFESLDIPSSILEYIGQNKLYFAYRINKLLSDKRYFHSFEVAKLSRLIAIANDVDALSAFIAGFLHDIGKEVPKNKTERLMNEHFPKFLDLPSWSHHQFIGSYMAENEFLIKDKVILDAIKVHATGDKKMSQLGKVLYVADKLDPSRGYDSSTLIALCVKDIDNGFVEVLRANKAYLEANDKKVDNRLTQTCFNTFLK